MVGGFEFVEDRLGAGDDFLYGVERFVADLVVRRRPRARLLERPDVVVVVADDGVVVVGFLVVLLVVILEF